MTNDPDPITAWLGQTDRTAFRKREIRLLEMDGQVVASCYPHGPGRPYEARGEDVPRALAALARLMDDDHEP